MTRRFAWRSLSSALLAAFLLLGGCNSSGGDTGMLVGPAGGTVTSADGLAEVVIPPGALAADVSITIRAASSPSAGRVGTAYEFGPDGTTFAIPVTITIEYDEADIPVGSTEADVRLGTVVTGAWAAVAGSTVDTAANTVSAETNHFSLYAAIAGLFPPPAGLPPIVFGTGAFEMFVYDSALPQPDRLWQVNEDGFWPAWRSLGAALPVEIAYSSFVGQNSVIKIMNVAASGGNLVYESSGRDAFQPAYSPDGTRISFSLASADGLESEIWVVNRDGSNPRRLTIGAYDVRSTWSPDGTMIAFERDGQGIHKVPADGSAGPTPLYTDPNYAPAAPDWGANGIVFQAYQAPVGPAFYGYRIAMVDAAGDPASLRWLTYNGTQIGDYAPKWSPDGTKILFVREVFGNNSIQSVDTSAASPGTQPPAGMDEATVIVLTGGSQVLGADW